MASLCNWIIVMVLFAIGLGTAPLLTFPIPFSLSTLGGSSYTAKVLLADPAVQQAAGAKGKATGELDTSEESGDASRAVAGGKKEIDGTSKAETGKSDDTSAGAGAAEGAEKQEEGDGKREETSLTHHTFSSESDQ